MISLESPSVTSRPAIPAGRTNSTTSSSRGVDRVAAPTHDAKVVELVASAIHGADARLAATAVTTRLARMLECDRVSLGFLEGRFVRIAAVSSRADIGQHHGMTAAIAAAMDEAIDQQCTIRYPALPGDRPRITLAHAEHARLQGLSSLCTVPLVRGSEVIGALTCERADGGTIGDEEITLIEAAALVGAVLERRRASERTLSRHAAAALAMQWARLRRPRSARAVGVVVMTMLLAATLPLWPMQYRVSAPARVEGSIQRALVAPIDGYLKQVHARPGDVVREGQVLAELIDEDLRLELQRLDSELARTRTVSSEAMARSDRAQVMIARSRSEEVVAQRSLIAQQIDRSRLVAPFDGVLISGDLTQQLGAPVRRGDVLLTVAPSGEYRVVLEVDDRNIGEIRRGQTAQVTFAALPDRAFDLGVERIKPVAIARDGRNFFEVEASLPSPAPEVRHGLEGVARIAAGERPVYRVAMQRAIDWIRIATWSLLP